MEFQYFSRLELADATIAAAQVYTEILASVRKDDPLALDARRAYKEAQTREMGLSEVWEVQYTLSPGQQAEAFRKERVKAGGFKTMPKAEPKPKKEPVPKTQAKREPKQKPVYEARATIRHRTVIVACATCGADRARNKSGDLVCQPCQTSRNRRMREENRAASASGTLTLPEPKPCKKCGLARRRSPSGQIVCYPCKHAAAAAKRDDAA